MVKKYRMRNKKNMKDSDWNEADEVKQELDSRDTVLHIYKPCPEDDSWLDL